MDYYCMQEESSSPLRRKVSTHILGKTLLKNEKVHCLHITPGCESIIESYCERTPLNTALKSYVERH